MLELRVGKNHHINREKVELFILGGPFQPRMLHDFIPQEFFKLQVKAAADPSDQKRLKLLLIKVPKRVWPAGAGQDCPSDCQSLSRIHIPKAQDEDKPPMR